MPNERRRWDLGTKRGQLEHALYAQIGYCKRGARHNQSRASLYRTILILAAAATTIVVGLQLELEKWDLYAKNMALVLSAIATAVASYESLKDYRGKWVLWQEVYLELLNLRARYNYLIAETANPDDVVESHWTELQAVLGKAHQNRIEGLAEATAPNADV